MMEIMLMIYEVTFLDDAEDDESVKAGKNTELDKYLL